MSGANFKRGYRIEFDGKTLNVFNNRGQLIRGFPASSGIVGVSAFEQHIRERGPTPEGLYFLDPKQFSGGWLKSKIRNIFGDWGTYRVPIKIQPGEYTFGRDNFFIHGGTIPGSKGCIDIGNRDVEFYELLKNHEGAIPINVRYPEITPPPWQKLPQSIKPTSVKVTPREIGIVHPYTVKANDRIWNLAPDYGYRNRQQFTQDVLKANPGLDPRRLRVGQIINLPLKTQLGGGIQSGAFAGALAGVRGGIRPASIDRQSAVKVTLQQIGIVHPYTVKANDRIWHLAPQSGYGDRRQFTQDVLKANPGLDPRRLRVGQIINLPLKTQLGGGIQSGASAGALAGVSGGIHPALTDYQGLLSHTVRKGENLTQIAQRYGTSVNALYDANRNIIGSNKNLIRPGQQFVIPQH